MLNQPNSHCNRSTIYQTIHTDFRPCTRQHQKFAQPVDLERLAQALRDQPLGLARVKGLLTDQQGVRWVLQLAGGQLSISAPEIPADPQRADRLVCIGVRSQWDHAAVLRLMNEHGGVPQ